MPIINLFTDFHNDPLYTGALLGALRSRFQGTIVETTHFLPYDNLMTASFIIKNLYKNLPKGTIHLICTNTSNLKFHQYLLFEFDGHYFIAADNGIIDLITDRAPEKVYSLPFKRSTFAEIEVFVPTAVSLANGKKPTDIAEEADIFKRSLPVQPVITGNKIQGMVIYIDSYGNAITNISRDLFERFGKGRNYNIWIGLPVNYVKQIKDSYRPEPGDFTALFNWFGMLELSVTYGNLAQMLVLKENQTEVVVEFH